MAKATIIVPIYNVENYVKRAIDSLRNQTESELEIILVDDGSTDSSGMICDEYAKKDNRIVVVHKINGGLSSARNTGTQKASSEYVMFLDGDDYLRKDAVECCLNIMEKYPSDFIQFQYREVNENDNPMVNNSKDDVYQAHSSKELFENLYRLGGVAASGATKFMRRELALEIPFGDIRHEDEMWCTRAFQRNLTVTYIPDELYYYVMRDNSIIHSRFSRKKMDVFTISEGRIEVLKKLNLFELTCYEYGKLFFNIVSLYSEARNANDKMSILDIKKLFLNRKNEIRKYAQLDRKYKLLFNLMRYKFEAVDIYRLYWNLKKYK